MISYKFSGHESFPLKHFWPLKGTQFLNESHSFSEPTAVVHLGVGKNMVSAIKFWLRSLGLTDENDNIQKIADYLFGENGRDKYIEDIGTIWLLHYYLVKTNRASIYNLIFNEFSKERIEFTKANLLGFLKRTTLKVNSSYLNVNTINMDISVFLRNYLNPKFKDSKINIEDDYSGLFFDLELITHYKKENTENKIQDYFILNRDFRDKLPVEIFLFTILDNNNYENSISFNELLTGYNSPGNIFLLNKEGLFSIIQQLIKKYSFITYSQTAGNQLIQFSEKPDKFEILNSYYAN
ncbi:MAG: DUF4007 family protein [Bacteroidales bacterium]|jgi:hypothetical protein|nr:DUF4007 family protein [Bacteroidales bacterium]MCK4638156.1 DUF4007 family protein [Bacteroidales bacterium]